MSGMPLPVGHVSQNGDREIQTSLSGTPTAGVPYTGDDPTDLAAL